MKENAFLYKVRFILCIPKILMKFHSYLPRERLLYIWYAYIIAVFHYVVPLQSVRNIFSALILIT